MNTPPLIDAVTVLRPFPLGTTVLELTGAKDALTQSRVLIHASSVGEVEKTIAPGLELADKDHKAGEDALAEYSFRRKGLGVSLFFILFLAAVIYLKIRRIERR